jgi:UrcA family protein
MFNRKINVSARLLLTLGAALIVCAPIGSQAADQTGKSMQLKVSDLDLSTAEGAHRLYRRIEQASYSVCGSQKQDTDVIVRGAGPCVRETIAHTVRELGIATLAQAYIQENGERAAQEFNISDKVRTAKN